jgi:hypothetical protein
LAFALSECESAIAASPRAAVAAAEAVSTARRALYECLIDLGWTPPPGVMEGMQLDTRLLDEAVGAGYDGMAVARPRPARRSAS